MKNQTITRRTMLAAMATAVCAPAFAAERTSGELKYELGIWVLDSVQRGMENPQLVGAIREKAKEILERAGVKLPVITPEQQETEREYWEKESREVADRKGPPDWAPAHGWRRKFGKEDEAALGDYMTQQVANGQSGPELISILQGQIEQVSKGGKVGDAPDESADEKSGSKKKGGKKNGKYGLRN